MSETNGAAARPQNAVTTEIVACARICRCEQEPQSLAQYYGLPVLDGRRNFLGITTNPRWVSGFIEVDLVLPVEPRFIEVPRD